MTIRTGLYDPFDGTDGSFAFNFSGPDPVAGGFGEPLFGPASSADPPHPVVIPDEAAEAQAAVIASGPGGPGSVVAQTTGGLTINLLFDAAAMAAPASFRAGIEQAAALLSAAISDH